MIIHARGLCLRVSLQSASSLPVCASAPDPRVNLQCASSLPVCTAESSTVPRNVGNQGSRKNSNSHIDASHSRQPLVKGERLVRYEVNAVMTLLGTTRGLSAREDASNRFLAASSSSFAHSTRSTGRSRRQRDLPEKNGAHVALSEKQRYCFYGSESIPET